MEQEKRAFELREMQEENGKIVGYAAVWDSLSHDLGGFREKIQRGAFADSLNGDVRAFFNHNPEKVLGRTKNGTLKLSEDETGLRMEITPPGTQWAKDVHAQIKRGDIDQASFMFRVVEDDWEQRNGEQIRTLKKVQLLEVSPVAMPAYEATKVSARALEKIKGEKEMTVTVEEPIKPGLNTKRTNPVKVLTRDMSLSDWVGRDALPEPYRNSDEPVAGRYIRGLLTGNWNGAEELRDMNTGTDTAGGYLIPKPLSARVIDLARNKSVLFQAGAQTVPMDAKTLSMARVAKDPKAEWLPELTRQKPADMAFQEVKFTAKTLRALTSLSIELAEDAQNIDTLIEGAMAEALAVELDRAGLVGDPEANEPTGLKNQDGVIKSITGGEVTDYSPIRQAAVAIMENNGQAGVAITTPSVYGLFDEAKDTTGQPLQKSPILQAVNVLHTNNMDAGALAVGDFSQLMVGMRTNLTIEASRVAGESMNTMSVLIRAYLRADIQLAHPNHFAWIAGLKAPVAE